MRIVKNRRSSVAAQLACIEMVEPRILMSVNAWKAAVSGDWSDASKWSLGHVPTQTEDVQINVAGNYTVTVKDATGTLAVHGIKVGGATGTQTLSVTGILYSYGSFSVGAGDAIDINPSGRFLNFAPVGTAAQLDGVINLNGTYPAPARLSCGASTINGTGQIVFNTGGANSVYENFINGNGYTLGAGITLRGKGGYVDGALINKGTIKIDGGTADSWTFGNLTNSGVFTSAGGETLRIYLLNNTAGHTLSVTGGSLYIGGNSYTNAGTINATNTKLSYAMAFTAAGKVVRTNSPVLFAGVLDGKNGTISPGDAYGQWIWSGGTLSNGTYDPTAVTALKVDTSNPSVGYYGVLTNITLSGDLNIPAGFYVNANLTTTLLDGKRILLNGSLTQRAALYLYGNLTGRGEVIFNTAHVGSFNLLSGNGWTMGAGVIVHGKSGTISGTMQNSGVILADTAGETISIIDVTNSGNIIAAPGTIAINRFTQTATGILTAGIGGTTAGTNLGRFQFIDANYVPTLAGTFNTVTLNGYAPAAGATFTIASFTKPPVGTFTTKNLNAGGGKAFDLTQTATALSVKAKNVAGAFASRSAAGVLSVTGTAGKDTIITKQSLGVLYATLNGVTSIFFDRQITTETIKAGADNDSVTVIGDHSAAIFGEAGNDSLTGGIGNDSLNGGEGNDLLIGGNGDDTYIFTAAPATQTDTIGEIAKNGGDTLDFSGMTTAVIVNLTSDTALATMTNRTIKTQAAGQAANIEDVIGGSGADKITGNAAANVLHGGIGNDILTGGAGADSLYGEAGNDTLFGGGDNTKDLLDGGTDTDVKGSADLIDILVSIP